MKNVRFVSSHGQQEVSAISVGLVFQNGEEKTVTDEQAAVLLTNADFSEVPAAPVASGFSRLSYADASVNEEG